VKRWRWIWLTLGLASLLFVLLLLVTKQEKERGRIASPPSIAYEPLMGTVRDVPSGEYGEIAREAVSVPLPGSVARKSLTVSPTSAPISLAAIRKLTPDRHLIKTASVTVETDDVGLAVQKAIALAKEKGGYLSSLSEQVLPTGQHSAVLEIRVPSETFEETMLAIEGLGKIRSKTVRAEDVSEEFLDIQSRLAALRESERRILNMLSKAETLDAVIRLENELASRRSEIERLEGRLRYLKERTTFCSISLTITEFRVIATPPETWAAVKVAADAWRELVKILRVLATIGIWLAVWSILWLPAGLLVLAATRFALAKLPPAKATKTPTEAN